MTYSIQQVTPRPFPDSFCSILEIYDYRMLDKWRNNFVKHFAG